MSGTDVLTHLKLEMVFYVCYNDYNKPRKQIRGGMNVATKNFSIQDLKDKTRPIFESYPISKAILFGSYSKNNASISSDIDLYIDTNGQLKGLDFVELIEILVNTLGIDVDLIDKTHIEPDSLIIQEIENGGMVLYEKSENYSKDNCSY